MPGFERIILRDTPAMRRKTRPSASKPPLKTKQRAVPKPPLLRRPLLVIDGNSFANRSYHALPKTILLHGRKPAGAVLGFANLLLRLYREEQPRAVLVAWDTLEVPTYRHEKFPAQSGREFDEALLEQLDLIPEFVAACGAFSLRRDGSS
jgi:5'-3' exonuclease